MIKITSILYIIVIAVRIPYNLLSMNYYDFLMSSTWNVLLKAVLIIIKNLSSSVLSYYALETEALKIVFESFNPQDLANKMKRHHLKKVILMTLSIAILVSTGIVFAFNL
jgi:hypothetical protein